MPERGWRPRTQPVRTRYLADSDLGLIGSAVALRLGYNSGIAFGLGAAIPSVVVIAVTGWSPRASPWPGGVACWAIPLRRALASVEARKLFDRTLGGGVVDMIVIGSWPKFSVADTLLNVSVIAAVIKELGRSDRSRRPNRCC